MRDRCHSRALRLSRRDGARTNVRNVAEQSAARESSISLRMKAFVVTPSTAGSGRVQEVAAPECAKDQVRVRVLSVGVDGTDRELLEGRYGEAPPGSDYLIIGHESLGRTIDPLPGEAEAGQLVVAIVRRPDPAPCLNCAAGEWDMCLNGRYTERGIKGLHGLLSELYVDDPRFLVRLPESLASTGVLLEPTSIVEKAIEQTFRIQQRLVWEPKTALVLGAGTIGTIACALLALRGFTVCLFSRGDGGKGRQVAAATGAHFFSSDDTKLDHDFAARVGPIDLIIEATGFSPLAFDAIDVVGPNGVVCLTGVSAGSRNLEIDSSHLNLKMVLSNRLVFGTVNANRRHFEAGVNDLEEITKRWPGLLESIITRRLRLEEFGLEALNGGDLKVVVELGSDS